MLENKFRQRSYETKFADKTDFIWDPEWPNVEFFNSPKDFSREAIATFSVHRDYLGVTSLTTDTTLSNFNATSNEKTSKNNLN